MWNVVQMLPGRLLYSQVCEITLFVEYHKAKVL